MKTMAISEFKAHALKVLNEVAKSQETIVITKRGKPLAQVLPYRESVMKPTPGKLSDAFVFENSQLYEYVIVFDDVVTTGSTIAELVKTIKRQGVKRVDVWSLARVPK